MRREISLFRKYRQKSAAFILFICVSAIVYLVATKPDYKTIANITGLFFELSGVLFSTTFWKYEHIARLAGAKSKEQRVALEEYYRKERQSESLNEFVTRKYYDNKELRDSLYSLEQSVSDEKIANEKWWVISRSISLFVGGTLLQMFSTLM